jgi:transcriptional regulator with XRE-family HTH domain
MARPTATRRKSLRQLALETGVSYSQVSRVFGGKRKPSIATALKLARALGLTIDQLINMLPASN